jgi:O-antigen biosynthesis protein
VYKPYVVVTPDFNTTSGGIRVMWGLYGWLLAKGQVTYINAKVSNSIAIYPEIINGNPVGSSTVVRYILNTPGVMGLSNGQQFVPGPSTFDPTDRLYYFSRLFGQAEDDNHYLFLPIINLHLFKDLKKKRNRTCFLIGKNTNKFKHPNDSIQLNREIAEDQGKLAELLNECHTFYCYDKITAMLEVARLCGCNVKYYGDYTKKELSKYEPGLNGISFGDEEVKLDKENFRYFYENMVMQFERKLDKFIDATQI